MSRAALTSLGIFAFLLLLVLLGREDRVSVGVRTLELPVVAEQDITRIAVGGERAALLERGEDGKSWTVEDPAIPGVLHRADSSHVERLLKAISGLKVDSFVSGRPEKHTELEIDAEQGTTLVVTAKSGVTLDLVLGRRAKQGGDLVRRSDSDSVFVAAGALASAAKRRIDDWRRRQFVSVEAADIASLRIQVTGEPAYTLERSDDGFRVAADITLPPGFQLDGPAAGRVATGVARLRADAFLDGDPGTASTGLGAGATQVELLDAAGSVVAHLSFGREDEQRRVPVRLLGDPQIYLVSQTRVNAVAPLLERLRDLSLTRADAAQVTSLTIRRGAERAALSKQTGTWAFVEPASLPADYSFDAGSVETRLASLARTRGTRFLGAEGETDFDFSDAVEVELQLADGSATQITFGGPLGASENVGTDEVAVKPGNGFVYAVRAFERRRYEDPLKLFERVAPPAMPPRTGGIQGLENLPPDVRRQIEQQLRQRGAGGAP